MKLKYTGDGEITLRGVTFKAGEPVDLSDNLLLYDKCAVLPYFAEVKTRKAKKAGDEDAA